MLVGATCTVFCAASATAGWIVFLIHFLFGFVSSFINCSICCTTHTDCIFCFVGCSINYCICRATCAGFCSTSATAGCVLCGANCAGFIAASAACPGTARHGDTTTGKQTHDTDSGKDLFQFLCIHGLHLQSKKYIFLPKKNMPKTPQFLIVSFNNEEYYHNSRQIVKGILC